MASSTTASVLVILVIIAATSNGLRLRKKRDSHTLSATTNNSTVGGDIPFITGNATIDGESVKVQVNGSASGATVSDANLEAIGVAQQGPNINVAGAISRSNATGLNTNVTGNVQSSSSLTEPNTAESTAFGEAFGVSLQKLMQLAQATVQKDADVSGAEIQSEISAEGTQQANAVGIASLIQTETNRTAYEVGNAVAQGQTIAWAKALSKYTDILNAQKQYIAEATGEGTANNGVSIIANNLIYDDGASRTASADSYGNARGTGKSTLNIGAKSGNITHEGDVVGNVIADIEAGTTHTNGSAASWMDGAGVAGGGGMFAEGKGYGHDFEAVDGISVKDDFGNTNVVAETKLVSSGNVDTNATVDVTSMYDPTGQGTAIASGEGMSAAQDASASLNMTSQALFLQPSNGVFNYGVSSSNGTAHGSAAAVNTELTNVADKSAGTLGWSSSRAEAAGLDKSTVTTDAHTDFLDASNNYLKLFGSGKGEALGDITEVSSTTYLEDLGFGEKTISEQTGTATSTTGGRVSLALSGFVKSCDGNDPSCVPSNGSGRKKRNANLLDYLLQNNRRLWTLIKETYYKVCPETPDDCVLILKKENQVTNEVTWQVKPVAFNDQYVESDQTVIEKIA